MPRTKGFDADLTDPLLVVWSVSFEEVVVGERDDGVGEWFGGWRGAGLADGVDGGVVGSVLDEGAVA